ncbi:MAG TPA: glycosyltransferase family 39 protein [Solirubrobacteraceae bacterium]
MGPSTVTERYALSRRSASGEWLAWSWPLLVITLVAALVRFSTLDLQSLWYDEAFTPVHTLHGSLAVTMRAVSHTENSPPLWYLLEWAITRVFGTGAVALRSLSALAGVLCVPVVGALGRELAGERAALLAAALIAVNPLMVWYSQEARAYELYVLFASLALLCFIRLQARQTAGRLAAFALSGALALTSHYFAVFMLAPMCLWLLRRRERLAARAVAVAAITAVGVALIPLVLSQAGHGTQWIGRWALSDRLQAIPQYYLTGYYGASLGHTIELLVALPIIAGVGYGLWRVLEPREERGVMILLGIAVCGMGLPILLVPFGVDYLAPRNLIAAMVPLTVLIAVVTVSRRAGRTGVALGLLAAAAFTTITIDTELSPRLQRGNWRSLARALAPATPSQAITTVELGSAPLEYYLTGVRRLPAGSTVTVTRIDEVGYAPLRATPERPPTPGFRLTGRLDINGLIVYRFTSTVPRMVRESVLRSHAITLAHPEVLTATSG